MTVIVVREDRRKRTGRGKNHFMDNNQLTNDPMCKGTGVHRTTHDWLRFSLLPGVLLLAFSVLTVTGMVISSTDAVQAQGGTVPPGPTPGTVPPPAVIYLGFKSSDEIEFEDDEQADFVYKNEDIVAFAPATGQFSIFFDGSACGLADANLDDFDFLANGNLIFTLRARFTLPGLGEVDDSDVIEYTPDPVGCGAFSIKMRGADVGLTKGTEDIDGLGVAEDGSLIVSTIGTAKVPGSDGEELVVKDQSLMILDEASGTWSLYFDGADVGLRNSSEDIRSVWKAPSVDDQGNSHLYLTLSGNFSVESNNEDEGDKNDVEGCTLLQTGETTECFFFKLLDGEQVGAENQLDGLAIVFDSTDVAAGAMTGIDGANSVESAAELASDAADFAEALAEGDDSVTIDDFVEVVTSIYLPYIER